MHGHACDHCSTAVIKWKQNFLHENHLNGREEWINTVWNGISPHFVPVCPEWVQFCHQTAILRRLFGLSSKDRSCVVVFAAFKEYHFSFPIKKHSESVSTVVFLVVVSGVSNSAKPSSWSRSFANFLYEKFVSLQQIKKWPDLIATCSNHFGLIAWWLLSKNLLLLERTSSERLLKWVIW